MRTREISRLCAFNFLSVKDLCRCFVKRARSFFLVLLNVIIFFCSSCYAFFSLNVFDIDTPRSLNTYNPLIVVVVSSSFFPYIDTFTTECPIEWKSNWFISISQNAFVESTFKWTHRIAITNEIYKHKIHTNTTPDSELRFSLSLFFSAKKWMVYDFDCSTVTCSPKTKKCFQFRF